MTQPTLFDTIFIDEFAGGGGASTGIEMATGRPIDIAINHDESAIMMHRCNHPYTQHYREDVWAVDPMTATRGRPVRLIWFSPDCKHFSKAKGAALVDRKIRGLAWIVLRWAAAVKPDVIMLENVEEFTTWGPVRKGKPVKKKAGQTYLKWRSQLGELGYDIETRILCAADYGAPTKRKRFCLIARRDGEPICWPVKEKYGVRVQRPLRPKTMRRIAQGVDKFVIKAKEPFIIPIGYGERPGQAPRVHDINDPMPTLVGSGKHYVCDPVISPFIAQQKFKNGPQDICEPLSTVTAVGAHELIAPTMIQYHSEQHDSEVRGQGLREPLNTLDGSNRYALSVIHLMQYYSAGNSHSHSCFDPISTLTAVDRESIVAAHLAHFKGKDKGQPLSDPLMTVTARDGQFGLITTKVVKWDGRTDLGYWPRVREMLNEYCGYTLADDELLLLLINGAWYFIYDIGLRMLTPREQYNAQGFPPDYIIDRDCYGNKISRADQVARCGNSVCPPMAEALVRANLPECCTRRYGTMKELHAYMAS